MSSHDPTHAINETLIISVGRHPAPRRKVLFLHRSKCISHFTGPNTPPHTRHLLLHGPAPLPLPPRRELWAPPPLLPAQRRGFGRRQLPQLYRSSESAQPAQAAGRDGSQERYHSGGHPSLALLQSVRALVGQSRPAHPERQGSACDQNDTSLR